MFDNLSHAFWYEAAAVAGAVLLYRAYRRRSANRTLSNLPEIYKAGLSVPPHDRPDVSGHDFLLPWMVQQARGGDMPPAFERLTAKELRLVELAHAAITLDDAAFAAARKRVSELERQALDTVRSTASDEARTTLAQIRGDALKQRTRRVLATPPAMGERSTVRDDEPVPASPRQDRAYIQVDNLLGWLPGNGNPDLWHLLVKELNYDHPSTLQVVSWIVGQAQCDRATAALALMQIQADAYMEHESREAAGYHGEAWSIAKTICERSEAGSYARQELNLSCVGEDNDQSGMLDMLKRAAGALAARGKVLPWPLPQKLFSKPFEGRDADREHYEVQDDRLYFRDAKAA